MKLFQKSIPLILLFLLFSLFILFTFSYRENFEEKKPAIKIVYYVISLKSPNRLANIEFQQGKLNYVYL